MTKKTKEAIKASSAIVLAVLAVLLLWIYPLNQAGKIVARFDNTGPVPDWSEMGLVADSLTPITEDNLKLAGWYLAAQGDSARGTCILVHGLRGGLETQAEKAKMLTDRGFNTFVYDQRGFGGSESEYYSGGFFEAADLQAVISRLDLTDRLIHPLVVWGEDHGGTAALKIWPRENRIDFVIAENPLVNGREWQKRIIKQKDMSAPSVMLPLIWWWMKQTSAYEIDIAETDISDAVGWAVATKPDSLLMIYCPDCKSLAELKDMGGNWLDGGCDEGGLSHDKISDIMSFFEAEP